MPLTFGASQADDANNSIGQSALGNNTMTVVTGWWYPTAVGTDVLWSMGDVACVQMASSTLINLTTDNVTTKGVWQGTFNALSNNTWAFLAFAGTFVNTPTGAVRMWQGTLDTPPTEVSVANTTAPVGNFTGNQTFTIGNKGTSATDAFDGDIANVTVMYDSGVVNVVPVLPSVQGAITQNEADLINQLYITPFWRGDFAKLIEIGRTVSNPRPDLFFDMNNGNTIGLGRANFGTYDVLLAVNGATKSATTGNPRPAISRPGWPLRRR